MAASRSPYTRFRSELLARLEPEFEKLEKPIKVLEAGGGSATFLSDAKQRFVFTTIDISPEQLANNRYAKEKILGDVQHFDYGERRFEIIVCYDILEHIRQPENALARLVGALAENGLMIIKGPIPQSLQGLVTKLTPHWVHVLFYRWNWPSSKAGQPGHAPFKTAHASAARPEAIRRALRSAGLKEVVYLEFATHPEKLKQRSQALFFVFRVLSRGLQLMTLGKYGGVNSDLVLVCRSPSIRG